MTGQRVKSSANGCVGIFVLRVHDEFVAGSVERNANAAFSALVLVAAFAFNSDAATDQISIKFVESFDFFCD